MRNLGAKFNLKYIWGEVTSPLAAQKDFPYSSALGAVLLLLHLLPVTVLSPSELYPVSSPTHILPLYSPAHSCINLSSTISLPFPLQYLPAPPPLLHTHTLTFFSLPPLFTPHSLVTSQHLSCFPNFPVSSHSPVHSPNHKAVDILPEDSLGSVYLKIWGGGRCFTGSSLSPTR